VVPVRDEFRMGCRLLWALGLEQERPQVTLVMLRSTQFVAWMSPLECAAGREGNNNLLIHSVKRLTKMTCESYNY